MEFFREKKKLIVQIIGITFIVFTIAPIVMTIMQNAR